MHNTGVLFYKSGYFNNNIIIDQAWAINAVYKVLDRESDYFGILKNKKGALDFYDIKTIWNNYLEKEQELFIDFMLSCELCLETTPNKKYYTPFQDRTFIVPQFLPVKPDYIEAYCDRYYISKKAITIRTYQFLPKIYIKRFIVKAGLFAISKARWANGILLFYEAENSFAIVEADYKTKSIIIKISPNCQQLLKVIENELNEIEGEGRVRPKDGKQGYDEIAFAENLSFKNLKPNTININHDNMNEIKKQNLKNAHFKVAVSFPGEKRNYVEETVNELAKIIGSENIFYDKWYDTQLARTGIDVILQNIYNERTDLVVVFLCKEYNEKDWCGIEWRAIKDLINTKQGEKVMLLTFDYQKVDGLFTSTDGMLDLRKRSEMQTATAINERLSFM